MNVPSDIAKAALGLINKPALGDSYFARAEDAISRCEDMASGMAAMLERVQDLAHQLECVMRSGRQCVCLEPRKVAVETGGHVSTRCGDRC